MGQPCDRLRDELPLVLGVVAGVLRHLAERAAEGRQHLLRMADGKEIDGRQIVPFDQLDVQFPHEARGGHPEIVADHDDALQSSAVALPQRPEQFGVVLVAGVQPLLELIEHEEDLLPRLLEPPAPQRRQRLDQTQVGRQFGQLPPQGPQQTGLGLASGSFHVDRFDPSGQARNKSRANQ